jgi:ubiquinol-cytochrome c reductase cytochrome b subunit
LKKLFDWFDDRTNYRKLVHESLYEHIPGGSRWRYVWGSTLVFCVVVQFITGLFLWMCYSPSAQTAWESVYYIQNEMAGGWLLRGIHHYTAQVMIVLLVLHVLQVVIDGAYRAPREFNFWVGLVLLQIVLGLGLTGYLLPWDQKGYWATKVATNIMTLVPFAGAEIQQLVVGGVDYGHHTLTRFFAVHAGLLPALLVVFVGLHMYFFRRQGVKPKDATQPDSYFWPDQILKDVVACLAVLAVILFLIVYRRLLDADAPLGAPLLAPAEPSEEFDAARPEWYFLFLFQFLKYFKGHTEVWGAIYIPGIVIGVMALMPFVGHWKMGRHFNIVFTFALVLGAAVLTGIAMFDDSSKPTYREAVAKAERNALRVVQLAQAPAGIPPEGATALLQNDPLTQGPELFRKNCSGCHRYDGHDGTGKLVIKEPVEGEADDQEPVEEPSSGADLKGFGSRDWLRGFLDPAKIASPDYYGGTAFADGKMVGFVEDKLSDFDRDEVEQVIFALSSEAQLPLQREDGARDAQRIAAGRELFGRDGINCTRCHKFRDSVTRGKRPPNTPDLTGWGSREWMVGIVSNPAHERFYGAKNDRMPAFGADEILDDKTIGLIVDWLREDWYRPGDPTSPQDVATTSEITTSKTPTEAPEVAAPDQGTQPEDALPDDADNSTSAPEETGGTKPAVEESNEEASATGRNEAATAAVAVTAPPGEAPDFKKVIQPLLETYCYRCHGGNTKRKPRGEYSMKTHTLALTPGDWGEPTVVPGKSAESYLYQLISSDDEEERMPPEREPQLTAEQIATIKTWIDTGAAWPDDVELKMPEKK